MKLLVLSSVTALVGLFVSPIADAVTLLPGDIVVAVHNTEPLDFFGSLIRIDPVTGAQTVISSGGSFVNPFGAAIAADGDILVGGLDRFVQQRGSGD